MKSLQIIYDHQHELIDRYEYTHFSNVDRSFPFYVGRRVWRYQKGNQNPSIEEEQTTQWPKEKVQKDKQRSTKHTYKTIDRVTRTPLKTGGELRCSGRVCRSCSTSYIRRVNLVTNPVISHERGKDREVFFLSSITDNTFTWLEYMSNAAGLIESKNCILFASRWAQIRFYLG
jgi:hypothetical protein